MPSDKRLASFHDRAVEAREIARGIFDQTERRVVLELLTDAEKLAAKEVKARKLERP